MTNYGSHQNSLERAMSDELKNKTALITGAAKRIGWETALTLANLGINIIVHFNHSDSEARQLAEELRQRREGVDHPGRLPSRGRVSDAHRTLSAVGRRSGHP